jgi:hypothetical protein
MISQELRLKAKKLISDYRYQHVSPTVGKVMYTCWKIDFEAVSDMLESYMLKGDAKNLQVTMDMASSRLKCFQLMVKKGNLVHPQELCRAEFRMFQMLMDLKKSPIPE